MNKHQRSKNSLVELLKNIVTFIILIALFFMILRLGMLSGRTIYQTNANIVRNLETGVFKSFLNDTIQVIEICYNSGKSSVSFSNEVKAFIGSIFNIDTRKPYSILNSQLAVMSQFNPGKGVLVEHIPREIEVKPPSRANPSASSKPAENTNFPEGREAASSISTRGEDENTQDEPDITGVSAGEIISPTEKLLLKNDSKFKVNLDELVKEPLGIKLDKKGPKVLVFHTHTTESYLKSITELNKADIPSWSEDTRYNVVRVGEEIAIQLRKNYGLDVIHNGTVHDKGSYDGSYTRSLETVNNILKSYPSIRFILDIHRDGLSSANEKKLRLVSEVNNKNAAPIMFVIGTDQNGQYHPRWRENLKLAAKLQAKLNTYYPGLTRPINLRDGRFNQHTSMGAVLIEVGGDGNTLEEALESARYLSKAIGELTKEMN